MAATLLDTSVAIPLRDREPSVLVRAEALTRAPYVSILTLVELEGGAVAESHLAATRRLALESLLGRVDVLPFNDAELVAYRTIISTHGYARNRVIDRLIAATALANGLVLATRNPKDFRDIAGLTVETW